MRMDENVNGVPFHDVWAAAPQLAACFGTADCDLLVGVLVDDHGFAVGVWLAHGICVGKLIDVPAEKRACASIKHVNR